MGWAGSAVPLVISTLKPHPPCWVGPARGRQVLQFFYSILVVSCVWQGMKGPFIAPLSAPPSAGSRQPLLLASDPAGLPSPPWGCSATWVQSACPCPVRFHQDPPPHPRPVVLSRAAAWTSCPARESEPWQCPTGQDGGKGARKVRREVRLPKPTMSHE